MEHHQPQPDLIVAYGDADTTSFADVDLGEFAAVPPATLLKLAAELPHDHGQGMAGKVIGYIGLNHAALRYFIEVNGDDLDHAIERVDALAEEDNSERLFWARAWLLADHHGLDWPINNEELAAHLGAH